MSYDRADAHYGGDFPSDLPPEAGATHIGMFLAWAILHGLEGDFHRQESADALAAVRARTMTGREFLIAMCDEKFTTEDLSDEGNAFTQWYYGDDKGHTGFYFADYEAALGGDLPTLYHVADTWDNYDQLAPVLSRRYLEWKNRRPRRRWWPFGRR